MKVALVYDRVNKWGGAERVLLALHELFPEAPLYTSVYHKEKAKWAKVFTIQTSFLQDFPKAQDAHEFYPLLMPAVFESFNFDEYDVVISVTSEAAKGIITKPGTLHICYCLTPTRYLWSGYSDYIHGPVMKALSYPAISYLKTWDKVAASRPDLYVAISEEVRGRIKKYYDHDAPIIHPPVKLFEGVNKTQKSTADYFLVVSRLVSYKRIDLAILACNKLKVPLKIVGVGSELERLRKLAGSTIEFLGPVEDEKLIPLYQNAKALLFPGYEDFGIVMGEALGFGIPVIAFKKGGALDIVEDKKSGLLFPSQTVASLTKAMQQFESMQFDRKALQVRAKLFSQRQFKKKFEVFIDQALQKKKKRL